MSRIQLAVNVTDIDASVEFYSKLFGTEPEKREPGYANFAISNPPLKLVLMEVRGERGESVVGALNHLGVEVESADEVIKITETLAGEGLDTEVQDEITCCFAVQDKVWVNDPDGAPWEFYTVLAHAPSDSGIAGDGSCCKPNTAGCVSVSLGDAPVAPCC
jgi:catechol 2,3-dioxygenase-like lactoylglutathione lyase family enzyme